LQLAEKDSAIMNSMRSIKQIWIGHVLRHNGMFRDVIEGRLLRKRSIGKRHHRMFDDLMECGCYEEMKRKPENRKSWRRGVKTAVRQNIYNVGQ